MQAELSCREASRLLSIACDRALTAVESESLEYHLGECLMCRHFDSQLRFLRKAASRFHSAR